MFRNYMVYRLKVLGIRNYKDHVSVCIQIKGMRINNYKGWGLYWLDFIRINDYMD
jgi:hypothetical protein